MASLKLIPATSPELRAECIAIRKAVFIQEQGYLHIDEDNQPEDAVALHFLLVDASTITSAAENPDLPSQEFMGTVRLLPGPDLDTYVLGRFALLPSFRSNGNGAKLIALAEQWLLQHVEGIHFMQLEAQDRASGFYEKQGYIKQNSTPYIKERTPHFFMKRDIRVQKTH